jgi:hypothetical protein
METVEAAIEAHDAGNMQQARCLVPERERGF